MVQASLSRRGDPRVRSFNERRLDGGYPFVMVDAMFIKSREDDQVVMRATLIASGIRSDGAMRPSTSTSMRATVMEATCASICADRNRIASVMRAGKSVKVTSIICFLIF